MLEKKNLIISIVALAFFGAEADALQKSKNVYRIPYANGTSVKVTRDHDAHTPKGRIDMVGKGSKPYSLVAAADGHIRYIVDHHSKRQDSSSGEPCRNNYVWIEHANGEWTKYSHLRKGSAKKDAKLKVGQFVKAGKFLGYEGDVGCASGSHLHFEVGVPRASDPITTTGGFLKDNSGSKRNRIPRICGISDKLFDSGKTYKARKVPGTIKKGSAEVARHGVPERDYQCLVDQAVSSGYMPVWVDGFDVKGKVFFNAVFRPAAGTRWAARHGLTSSGYQKAFDGLKKKGYRPIQVESYLRGGSVRYAAIFVKKSGPAFAAYHGLSASAHQKKLDSLIAKGYRPVNMSVVSPGGNRSYTVLMEKRSLGSYQAKSFLSASQYQSLFTSNAQAGRKLIYLNAYQHKGSPRFSAIWSSKAKGGPARHGLTSSAYQSVWKQNTSRGHRTQAVTGYSSGSSSRYAAFWTR